MPDTDPLNQLKEQWQQLNMRTSRLEEANKELTQRLTHSRASTTQQRLARDTRRWGMLGFLFVPLALPVYRILEMPLWFVILYMIMGIVMGCLSIWLSNYITAERLVDMPVTDAYERACDIRHKQWQCRITGIILGSILLILMFILMFKNQEPAVIWGALAGLVFGLFCGIRKAIGQHRMSRQLINDFKSE